MAGVGAGAPAALWLSACSQVLLLFLAATSGKQHGASAASHPPHTVCALPPLAPPPHAAAQAAELPTTNGAWAQGEGLALAQAAGASLLHLDRVQVHPTGFVDPADPASGTKVGREAGARPLPGACRWWLPGRG